MRSLLFLSICGKRKNRTRRTDVKRIETIFAKAKIKLDLSGESVHVTVYRAKNTQFTYFETPSPAPPPPLSRFSRHDAHSAGREISLSLLCSSIQLIYGHRICWPLNWKLFPFSCAVRSACASNSAECH